MAGGGMGGTASPAHGETRPKGKGQGPRARPLLDVLAAGTSRCGWQVFGTGWATMRRLLGTVEAFSSRARPAWAPALQAPQCLGMYRPALPPRRGPEARACSELSAGGTQSLPGCGPPPAGTSPASLRGLMTGAPSPGLLSCQHHHEPGGEGF